MQQVQLMQNRQLVINDVPSAVHYLENISYYRLSAYMLPFQLVKDVFNAGTTFQQIIDLYVFDRELRLIVLDAIERVEISIRSQIIYQLAHKYGSHWQDDPSIFRYPNVFNDIQQFIATHCVSRNPEVFVAHYLDTYDPPATPPSWMSIELLTIGQLSMLFKAIKQNSDRKDIADYYGLHHNVFQSWLHTITYVRNICAHHARLWNRDFAIQPDLLQRPQLSWINSVYSNNRRSYYFLCLLQYLLQTANPNGHLKTRLTALFQQYPQIPIQYMGVPANWDTELLWQ